MGVRRGRERQSRRKIKRREGVARKLESEMESRDARCIELRPDVEAKANTRRQTQTCSGVLCFSAIALSLLRKSFWSCRSCRRMRLCRADAGVDAVFSSQRFISHHPFFSFSYFKLQFPLIQQLGLLKCVCPCGENFFERANIKAVQFHKRRNTANRSGCTFSRKCWQEIKRPFNLSTSFYLTSRGSAVPCCDVEDFLFRVSHLSKRLSSISQKLPQNTSIC